MTPPPGTRTRAEPRRRTTARSAPPRRPRPPTRTAAPAPRGRPPLASPARRLRLAFGALVVVVLVVAGRLIQLQGLDGASYAQRAEDQRRRVEVLPAARGAIVDRNGIPLAMSVATRTIFADPKEVADAATARTHRIAPAEVATRLAPLVGLPAADVLARITWPGRYVILRHDVPVTQARAILVLELPGIGAEPDSLRVYPSGNLAGSLLGVVPNDDPNSGVGLEHSYNALLAGRPGRMVAEYGAGGQAEIPAGDHTERPAVPGSTIQLTLDRDVQWAAERALDAQVRAVHADSGAAIVMDPRTGQLLAMASAPSFDPNRPGKAKPAQLHNHAVEDVYEPGSVNKVITVAAALAHRDVTPATPITVPGTLPLVGEVFHDAETHGTEHLTVAGVLAKSSNIGTIKIAQRLGRQNLYAGLRAFGFGARSGAGFPGESGGILPPPDEWSASQQYTIAFGQGVSVTALQVASVYATIANGGVRVAPTLVAGRIGPNGARVPTARPDSRRVVSAAVAGQVRDMLEAVTSDEGTAPKARIAGYRVAGKTGTAQRPNPRCGCYAGGGYTASFIGFAPADAPRLLVEVVLQNPRNGHFGGQVAAPVFHDIMSFALKSLRVPPTGTKPPTIALEPPRPSKHAAPRP